MERPERLSLKMLMALLDILDCTMADWIEPLPRPARAARKKKAACAEASLVACVPSAPAFTARDSSDQTRTCERAVATRSGCHGDGRGGWPRLTPEQIRAVAAAVAGGRAKWRRLA